MLRMTTKFSCGGKYWLMDSQGCSDTAKPTAQHFSVTY